MKMPEIGSKLTEEQVKLSINIKEFHEWEIEKGWHSGLWEPWAPEFGYPDGLAIYGGLKTDKGSAHIYFLNDGHQLPIILLPTQTPQTYGVKPTKRD